MAGIEPASEKRDKNKSTGIVWLLMTRKREAKQKLSGFAFSFQLIP